LHLFSFPRHATQRQLHSFPTRRSSDLAKVDFQARDNDGNTPLHIAAKAESGDVLDWLVKHGGDLDVTNNSGETPRVLAAHNKVRSEEHTSELQSRVDLVCRLLLEKKKE